MGFCSAKVSKVVIVVLNIIFILLGLAIMIPGILMFTSVDFLSDNIEPLLEKISINELTLASLSSNLPTIFIVLGGIIIFIALLGVFGACCKLKTCLVVYAIIVIILAVVQLVVLAFFFLLRSELDSTIRSSFEDQLNNYQNDVLDKSDEVSSSYNYLFMEMECCGVNPVTGTTNDFDSSPWRAGSGSEVIPKACCKGATADNYATFTDTACTQTVTSGKYHSDGCYDKIMSTFGNILNIMGYVGVAVLVLEVLVVVFAFCLCCEYMKVEKVEQEIF